MHAITTRGCDGRNTVAFVSSCCRPAPPPKCGLPTDQVSSLCRPFIMNFHCAESLLALDEAVAFGWYACMFEGQRLLTKWSQGRRSKTCSRPRGSVTQWSHEGRRPKNRPRPIGLIINDDPRTVRDEMCCRCWWCSLVLSWAVAWPLCGLRRRFSGPGFCLFFFSLRGRGAPTQEPVTLSGIPVHRASFG